ncbi:MAG: metal-dependent hydrolase [Desulfuromonadaceae bacterium]|nr:metal-dependent hydrolase [Desulfuromonadaceae bacterium]MDD5104023.1 metal-dependent hydrolase [Desulfuromonadaceae bacterium]
MKKLTVTLMVLAVLLLSSLTASATGTTDITWYGHSAFKVTTPSGKVLLIDPWLANPANPKGKELLAGLDKADQILLTHAHGDHVGNTVEIAKKTGAKLVASNDLMKAMIKYADFPAKQADFSGTGNFGGTVTLLNGEVKVTFVHAPHSSALEYDDKKGFAYAGNPGGFVIAIAEGPTIYHTGDTDLFGDMKLIGDFSKIDVMMACIGDKFTMGPERAAAAVALVNPKMVIPMHFGTFAALTGTPEVFEKAMKQLKLATVFKRMQVNETFSWK